MNFHFAGDQESVTLVQMMQESSSAFTFALNQKGIKMVLILTCPETNQV